MNYLKETFRNIAHTSLLQKKYQNLTGWIGIFGSFFGLFLACVVGYYLLLALGVDLDKQDSPEDRSIWWLLLGVSGFFILTLIGLLVFISVFSCFMYAAGKFTKSEARYYSLRSRYPKYWYKEEYKYLIETEENEP
jgi:ABC-type antimicrobial peptide transport system permease subunit